MSKIFSNLFSRRSNKLQTDAGIIPQQQNEPQVDDSDEQDEEQQQQCEYQRDLLRNNSQSDSIPPLKQHMLAVEEISQRNRMVEYPGNNSLMQPNPNNNLVGSSPGTVNNTVFQFSHIQGLHIGSVNYNSQTSVNSDNSQQNGNGRNSIDNKKRIRSGDVLKKTRTIDDMMKSSDTMDHPLMELISTHLGEDWRMVVRDLGFSNAQLDQFQEDNIFKGVKETIYQCLLDWSRNDETACLGKISRLLWKKGHKETVYILKEYWKTVRTPEIEVVGKKID